LILYTHQSTPADTTAIRDFLDKHNLHYQVVDVTTNNELQSEIKKRKNAKSEFPQVFINSESLGGLDNLKQLEVEAALTGIKKRLTLGPVTPQKSQPTGRTLLTPPQSPNSRITLMEEENKVEKLVRKMRDGKVGLKISNRNFHTKNYKRVFSGSEFVDWILKNRVEINSEIPSDFLQDVPDAAPTTPNLTPSKQPTKQTDTGLIKSKSEAIKLGQKLLNEKLIKSIQNSRTFSPDSTQFYRFQLDEVQHLLNMDKIWSSKIKSESQLITDLQNQINNLYEHFSSHSATSSSIPLVNYSALAKSEDFSFFKLSVAKLQKFNLNYFRENPSTTKNLEEVCFFTNIYNILVIHGIIAVGAPQNAIQRAKFFSHVAYNIGGLIFSLNDIEHGILRGNLYPRPGKPISNKQFGVNDERLLHVIPEAHIDVRALLCLNRGSVGSALLRVYEADTMEKSVRESVEKYVKQTVRVDNEKKELRVGKLLDWYAVDFGGVEKVVEFVGKNGGVGEGVDVKEWSVRFDCFDWRSNEFVS